MKYPEFLSSINNRIGFVAPSFGCILPKDEAPFNSAISYFKALGFEIFEGPNCRVGVGVGKSNTPEKCAEEINDVFLNHRADAIISCAGGELMCEDLDFVDFSGISASKPIWYMGYSDNTCLTFLLPTLCDIATIYGCNAKPFGLREKHPSILDAISLLKGEKLSFHNYEGWENFFISDAERNSKTEEEAFEEPDYLAPYNINDKYHQINGGKLNSDGGAVFSGRMLGGCLDVMLSFVGTKYDKVREFNEKYKEDGIIWFFESCDLNPFSVRRAMWQLKNAGWLENVKGFLIGRPLHFYEEIDGFNCREAALGILKEFDVSVIMDIDLGHLSPRMPFITGALATVKATKDSIEIDYQLK